MADVIGISDVSSKDVGAGSQLKTGNLKRSHNMPKECVKKLISQGKSPEEAHRLCYPKKKGSPIKSSYKDTLSGAATRDSLRTMKKESGY